MHPLRGLARVEAARPARHLQRVVELWEQVVEILKPLGADAQDYLEAVHELQKYYHLRVFISIQIEILT